jgi:hypothetical protein
MEIKMTSFRFPTIKRIEPGGDVVNEKLCLHMGIFAYLYNKFHITKPINNLSIEMHASMSVLT